MTFHSILFESAKDDVKEETIREPAFFVDLNLDQVVHAIAAGRDEYHITPFFYHSLKSVGAIEYRHEIMQELEDARLFLVIQSFSKKMQTMRANLAQAEKLHHHYQKKRWFLHAVEVYCDAVDGLAHELAHFDLTSRGFSLFYEYLAHYTNSGEFTSLVAELQGLRTVLSGVKYCLIINGKEITVRKAEEEGDFHAEIERIFERFKQGSVQDYTVNFPDWPAMNHVEEKILDFVTKLYPKVFLHLDSFQETHAMYLDATIARFDREIQFYCAYLEFMRAFRNKGLHFCIPLVSDRSKEICVEEGFDIALATKLAQENTPVVCNDCYLKGRERIFVVTGPNQGGKTTFARTFGQLHHLASLGCPVPGRKARLFLFDRLFTHFEREEDIDNLRSKLEDDLVRIHSILTECSSKSIVIINEMFTSTTIQDALFLGERVLEQVAQLDILCVYVTFLDELTTLDKTVSVVSRVDPANPELRTYKIERLPADGLSYAIALARKNHLTYEEILERVKP